MPVVDELNARFATGRPSDTLRSAGILIHQFDGRDDPNPDGILAGLAEEKNLELGELGTVPDEANVNGILDGLKGKQQQ